MVSNESEDETIQPEAVPVHVVPNVIVAEPLPNEGGHTNPLPMREDEEHTAIETRRTQNEISPMDDVADCPPHVHPSARRLCGSAASSASDSDTADDAPLLPDASGRVRIDIPEGEKPASPHDRFPKERGKALISCLLLVSAAILTDITLSFVHEKVPDTPPLPDIIFEHTPYFKPGLEICEYIMITVFVCTLILILFHRHRWIILRRLALIGALLYLMRCVTMIVTQVPVADPNFYCSPKLGENGTFWRIVVRGLRMVTGVGLNVQGKNTLCGDYIYSGHTLVLVMSALFITEYSPRRWWPVHFLAWASALVAVVFLVISRGHYTLDVILSYFICTRLFWNYHTMAAHPTLRHSNHNHHRKEYWFHLFAYMEKGIQKPVPRRFNSPVPLDGLIAMLPRRNVNERIE